MATPEAPQEVNLGAQMRAKLMQPGEVFLGNYPKGSGNSLYDFGPYTKFSTPSVPRRILELQVSGQYESVRSIIAYRLDGDENPLCLGIVVKPNKGPR